MTSESVEQQEPLVLVSATGAAPGAGNSEDNPHAEAADRLKAVKEKISNHADTASPIHHEDLAHPDHADHPSEHAHKGHNCWARFRHYLGHYLFHNPVFELVIVALIISDCCFTATEMVLQHVFHFDHHAAEEGKYVGTVRGDCEGVYAIHG